jgi:hypothetical protein
LPDDFLVVVRAIASASGSARFQAGKPGGAFIDQMVGVDFTRTLQREGGVSALAQLPFQALAVGRFDAHAGIEREAATVLPVRHRLGVCQLEHNEHNTHRNEAQRGSDRFFLI